MKHLLTVLIMLGGLVSLFLAVFLIVWLQEKCKCVFKSQWFEKSRKMVGWVSIGALGLIFILILAMAYYDIYSKL